MERKQSVLTKRLGRLSLNKREAEKHFECLPGLSQRNKVSKGMFTMGANILPTRQPDEMSVLLKVSSNGSGPGDDFSCGRAFWQAS